MRGLRLIGLVLGVLGLFVMGALAWAYQNRPALASLGLATATAATSSPVPGEQVTVTWLGVTTLLFDDGETRLLTDGFFSRPTLLDLALDRPVAPDVPGIERALARAGITSLAAVMPVHSHYDHAMDVAEVARRTGARVVGSPSTAQIARGGELPETQIDVVADGERRSFGRFTLTFVRSRHAPIASGGAPFPGTIEAPLVPPAPVSAWREDRSYSIVIVHPTGTAIVQGSAGFVEGALRDVRADAVFLGVGGLGRLGREYTDRYWEEIVGASAATRVFPVHYDDFTKPYGEIVAFPEIFGELITSVRWLRELAAPDVALELLPFEQTVELFPPPAGQLSEPGSLVR